MLSSFALIFLILAIWQFNTFCIPAFLSVIFTMVVTLIFIFFIALIFNIYMKLTCVTGVFINFLIHIFVIFTVLFLEFIIFPHLVVFCLSPLYFFIHIFIIFSVLFLEFIIFPHLVVYCLWPLYFFCVFLLIFYMFIICFLLILVNIIYHQVLLFSCSYWYWQRWFLPSSNNKNSFNDSWLLFAALFFFLKVWFKGTLMQIWNFPYMFVFI